MVEQQNSGIILRDLKHLVNWLRGDCEQNLTMNLTIVGHVGSLVQKVISLEFEDKLVEVKGLGIHVEGYIGFPKDNFIALLEEDVFKLPV